MGRAGQWVDKFRGLGEPNLKHKFGRPVNCHPPSDSPMLTAMRLFVWSDLHVDYPANFQLLEQLSRQDFQDGVLLVAGDVSSDPEKTLRALTGLRERFAEVAFVPGNHDLWVTSQGRLNSLEKLHELRSLCRVAGIRVDPFSCSLGGRTVRILPLLSWYLKPEEGPGSLFLPKPGEDPELRMWADNHRIKWPALPDNQTPAEHLLALNSSPMPGDRLPVITFSHFLPRVELVFSDWARFQTGSGATGHDRAPEFNFTRVAGCRQLDEQLRKLGSTIHLYGHQHRNRDREIDGVRYVSHCLGYPPEWREGTELSPRRLPLEICRSQFPQELERRSSFDSPAAGTDAIT